MLQRRRLGKRLHLSQADQILENTLATTLLNRSARGVALTESGQRCYEHALEILTQYQRLVDDVTQIKTRPER